MLLNVSGLRLPLISFPALALSLFVVGCSGNVPAVAPATNSSPNSNSLMSQTPQQGARPSLGTASSQEAPQDRLPPSTTPPNPPVAPAHRRVNLNHIFRNVVRHPLVSSVVGFAESGQNFYVATKNGLLVSRDGGHAFEVLDSSINLINEAPTSVAASGQSIYVGTQEDVWLSNNEGSSFIPWRFGASVNQMKTFGGEFYLATNRGLFLSTRPNVFSQINREPTHSLHLSDDRIFQGTTDGVNVLLTSNFSILWSELTTRPNAILTDATQVYVGTEGGILVSLDAGATFPRHVVLPSAGRAHLSIHAFAKRENRLYAGTSEGIWIFDCSHLMTDPGTRLAGHGLPSQKIQGLYYLGNRLFAGTDQGLAVSDDGGENFLPVGQAETALASNDVEQIFTDGPNLYIADRDTNISISHDSGRTFRSFRLQPPVEGRRTAFNRIGVRKIFAAEGRVFILTAQRALHVYHEETGELALLDHRDGFDFTRVDEVFLRGRNLYLGTMHGLFVSRNLGDHFETIPVPQAFRHMDSQLQFQAIYDNGEFLYAATNAAIGKWGQNGIFMQSFGVENGLPDDMAMKIRGDGNYLYFLYRDGRVFTSRDAGHSFQAIPEMSAIDIASLGPFLALALSESAGVAVSPEAGAPGSIEVLDPRNSMLRSYTAKKVRIEGNRLYVGTLNGLSAAELSYE